MLDGLVDEELDAILRRSNVITCRAGDRLLKTGGSARNAFVVLDGTLAVSRDGTPVGTVGPGEIVGEMAYLLHQPRAFDVDVTQRRHAGPQPERADPGDAHRRLPGRRRPVLGERRPQLCRRLAAATGVVS